MVFRLCTKKTNSRLLGEGYFDGFHLSLTIEMALI